MFIHLCQISVNNVRIGKISAISGLQCFIYIYCNGYIEAGKFCS